MTADDSGGRKTRAELRELLAKATPGPWDWKDGDSLMTLHERGEYQYAGCVLSRGTDDCGYSEITGKWEDKELVAAAVNALPDLLDAIATLEKTLVIYAAQRGAEGKLAKDTLVLVEATVPRG